MRVSCFEHIQTREEHFAFTPQDQDKGVAARNILGKSLMGQKKLFPQLWRALQVYHTAGLSVKLFLWPQRVELFRLTNKPFQKI